MALWETHEGWRRRIQAALDDPHEAIREYGAIELLVWSYQDAGIRKDLPAMASAWAAFLAWPANPGRASIATARLKLLDLAAGFGDFDAAADLVLEFYPLAALDEQHFIADEEERNRDYWRRVDSAAGFVAMCMVLLLHEPFLASARADEVDAAMRAVASRNEDVLTGPDQEKLERVGEVRARYHSRMTLAGNRGPDGIRLPWADQPKEHQQAAWRAAVNQPGEISARAQLDTFCDQGLVGDGGDRPVPVR